MKLKQLSLFPKCSNQCWEPSHPPQCFSGMLAELNQVLGTEMREIMLFPMPPDIFHRIELRRIGWKKLNLPLPRGFVHKIPDQAASMASKPIPDDEKITRDMVHKMREELDDLRTSDCARKQSKVKGPPCNARDCRKSLPLKVILKNRSLPAGQTKSDNVTV